MKKIPTIFQRNWDGNRGVVNQFAVNYPFNEATPTEKIDGTNVRLTVRNHMLVRLEKRRNPKKTQKAQGIEEPWYVDADEFDPGDKFLFEAARNTDLSSIPDGEWSGEAVGPKIQGNPLSLESHTVCLFSRGGAPILKDAPHTFDELKEWLPKQNSMFGNGRIEGIVWHHPTAGMCKIKAKDFK